MKKVSSSTVTSLIAVMSMNMLFFCIFALLIINNLSLNLCYCVHEGIPVESVSSREGLDNGKSYFVEAVGQLVNLIGIIVVGDDSQCSGQDTESRVD